MDISTTSLDLAKNVLQVYGPCGIGEICCPQAATSIGTRRHTSTFAFNNAPLALSRFEWRAAGMPDGVIYARNWGGLLPSRCHALE